VSPRAQNVVRRGSAAAARTVWSRICRQTLADVNGLMFMIQQLLMWDVERSLEDEILAGSGTGSNVVGILNTNGIGASASATGDRRQATA
jgi:hypothetical protein